MLQQEQCMADPAFFHQMNNGLLKVKPGGVVHAAEIHDVDDSKHSSIVSRKTLQNRQSDQFICAVQAPSGPHENSPAHSEEAPGKRNTKQESVTDSS